jgi:acyl-CoA hydrolase/GNAT superfamily N-acetyltransferase
MFEKPCISSDEALAGIKKGSRLFISSGCGEPQHLVECLLSRSDKLYDVEIIQVLSTQTRAYTSEKLEEHFRVKNFFAAGREGAREAVWEGHAEYIPMFMSSVPRLFTERMLELDGALIQVSPPNEHGYMSLGVAVDVAKEAIAAAELVIAQVNPSMPVTLGDSFVHISEVDAMVEYREPLLEVAEPILSETDILVGGNVARLVEDGSTIHAGLGHLPKAALAAMIDKKDLGVHTDMFTDSYLDLIQRGVITNRRKTAHPNRVVASYCIGTRSLFKFIHMNPFVEFYPVAQTNDPFMIGSHDQMISIHEAMEVDLTGQIGASGGNQIYSGIGGLVDFMRGSFRSPGGKFIIALRATSDDGQKSNIVPMLSPQSGLMASRAAAHYVVTEFGSVNLQAKSLRERAVALIEIAHPNFREDLYKQAQDQGLLGQGDPITLFKPVVYPQHLERYFQFEDESLLFRPVKASDVRAIQEFFYGLDNRDIHYRFLRSMKAFPRKEMAAMASVDYHNRMTILVLKGDFGFERVVAIGRYFAVDRGDLVEVDVAVADDYRRKGVGRSVMKYVFEIAEANGFKGVMAYVAHDNPKTLKMVKTMGYRAKATLNMGVFEIEMRFDEPVDEPTMEIIYPERD